jgi:hypothetical protein
MKRKKTNQDGISAKGFFHVHIVDADGALVGDSGVIPNVVTDDGFYSFLCLGVANTTGSKHVTHIALGTGTATNITHTQLNGEIMSSTQRQAITAAASSDSRKMRLTATFTAGFLSTTSSLQNIGLYNSSSGGALMCGNSFTSSTCASNQAVNVTYDLIFA